MPVTGGILECVLRLRAKSFQDEKGWHLYTGAQSESWSECPAKTDSKCWKPFPWKPLLYIPFNLIFNKTAGWGWFPNASALPCSGAGCWSWSWEFVKNRVSSLSIPCAPAPRFARNLVHFLELQGWGQQKVNGLIWEEEEKRDRSVQMPVWAGSGSKLARSDLNLGHRWAPCLQPGC